MEPFLILLLIVASIWMATRVSSHQRDLNQIRSQIMPLIKSLVRLEERVGELKRDIQALQADHPSGGAARAERTRGSAAPTVSAPSHQEPIAAAKMTVASVPQAPLPVSQTGVAHDALPSIPYESATAQMSDARPAPPQLEAVVHPTPAPFVPETPRTPVRNKMQFDWEGLIGVKLFSWIAGIALAVAAVFFLKYSIAQGWLQPPVQMAIGIITGFGLLALCELKAANRYRITANAMDASALAILFATFYAAGVRWHLIGTGISFLFLVLVTALAVWLSIRRDSLFIALLGLFGGFSTPALLSTGENHPVELFGYLLLLNAGIAWVAARKKWPMLTIITLILTTLYQWGWVGKFLTEEQLPLAAGIFLIFPILAFATLSFSRRQEGTGTASLYGISAESSALLPVLFASYLASVSGYGEHYGILFGFLFLLAAGLFVIAVVRRREMLHLAGALSTLVVFAVWVANSYDSSAWPEILAFLSLFVLFYLAAPAAAALMHRDFTGPGRHAVLAAPLLFPAFSVLAAIEPRCAAPELMFGVLLVLLACTAAYAAFRGQGTAYYLGAFFAVAAEAVWSARHLAVERLVSAVVIYTIFALFYLGAPLAAGRWYRKLHAGIASNAVFLGLFGHLFLLLVATNRTLAVPPHPLLSALVILDLAIGMAVLFLRRYELMLGAAAASALILLAWTETAPEAPFPSVAIVAALMLVLFCYAWISPVRLAGASTVPFAGTAACSVFLAQIVVIAAAEQTGAPGVGFLVAAHVALLAALLGLAWVKSWHLLAPLAVLPTAAAVSLWMLGHSGPEFHAAQILFAGTIYLAFISYPFLLGRRAGRSLAPYLAAVLANGPFFFQARHTMLSSGMESVIGVLPVAQAAILGVLLLRLLRMEPPEARVLGRLALVAGAVLAFITLAIPLQLDRQWITIGWVLEGAALAWLFLKIPHQGLLLWSTGLFAVVFARLAVHVLEISEEPRSGLPIWNWHLYTYLVAAAAMFLGGWLYSRAKFTLLGWTSRVSGMLSAGGAILLFLLLNIEIADYYAVGDHISFRLSATLAQDLTYTLGWAVFAVTLLAAGIALRSQAARIAALGLMVVTILKCFLYDLSNLGGLYRVVSFVGLAVCLLLVALALQKFVLAARRETPLDAAQK